MASRQPLPAAVAIDRLRIPAHIAIIMDGNGRWAAVRGLPRSSGHRAGLDAVRRTIEGCRELGVRVLTMYAFSTENWRRPDDEVGALLDLLHESLIAEAEELHRTGIRLRVSGALESIDHDNQAMILNIAFNYGGRAEIARAARLLAADVQAGRRLVETVDEAAVAGGLYTADLPDPDLLIRTGGEQRLSNFLLWQTAYTELSFLDVYWPDFTRDHLTAAIAEYQHRQRRFGGTQSD